MRGTMKYCTCSIALSLDGASDLMYVCSDCLPLSQGQGHLSDALRSPFLRELRQLAADLGQAVCETVPASKGIPARFKRMRLAALPSSSSITDIGAAAEASPKLAQPPPGAEEAHGEKDTRKQQQQQQEEDVELRRERKRHDRAVDAQRGPPPAPCCDWLMEQELVPDLLMVWELCMVRGVLVPPSTGELEDCTCTNIHCLSICHLTFLLHLSLQSFSYLFGLPPMSFRALEASVCPLPLLHRAPAVEGTTPATELLDPAAAASSLLLRDLHHGLLRVADGWSPKHLREAPEFAQPVPSDPRALQWQERLWLCLLSPAHAAHLCEEARVGSTPEGREQVLCGRCSVPSQLLVNAAASHPSTGLLLPHGEQTSPSDLIRPS